MVFHFSTIGLKLEFSNVDITLYQFSHCSPDQCGVFAGYFVVYIFHVQTWKAFYFFTAFICSLGLLLLDSTILLAVNLSECQNGELLLRHLEISTS